MTKTDPNYGSYHYTYNAYNQKLTKKDPKGQVYHFTYDNLGNIESKTGPEGTYNYTYGLSGGPNVFKLRHLDGPDGTITYYYGSGDQVKWVKRENTSVSLLTEYTYNSKGQLAARTFPNGSTVSYTYNPHDGTCAHIGIPGETINTPYGNQPAYIYTILEKNEFDEVTQAGFGTMSNPGTYIPGAGLTIPHIFDTKSYNQYGLLTGQTSYKMNSFGPSPNIRALVYNFSNASHNLMMRKDNIHQLKEDFTYDNLNRLTQIQGQSLNPPSMLPVNNIQYSDNGNITQKSDAGTFSYDQANRVSEIDPYVNIPEATQTLTYTPFNKVKTISENGITDTFTYWPDGRRASMTLTGGQHPRTVYYAPDYEQIVAGGASTERVYLRNENGAIAAILETTPNSHATNRYYVLTDYLGSLTHILKPDGSIIAEKSYDAWGRYRHADTWESYAPTYANMTFYRGYTGHEYIPEFGIINMNGRLYDPLLGRMFSPDPYIQEFQNTQNYNRYAYVLNNPLKYTDPSGQFFILDDWLIGFVGGFFSTGSHRWSTAWHSANLRTGNEAKIWGGLLTTNPNKSFWGRSWGLISRFTWQLPQTLGGFLSAQSYNTFGIGGGVASVNYKFGATVLRTRNSWGAFTQGSFIIGDKHIKANPNNALFQHEYGHYLQSQAVGLAYYPRYAIPSLLSNGRHDFHPVEQDANRRAFLYFNKNVDGFYDVNPFDGKGWDFYDNPLDVNRSGNRGKVVDYYDPLHIKALKKLKVSPKWYDYAPGGFGITGAMGIGLINAWFYNH